TLKYEVNGKLKESTYYLAILLNSDENIALSEEHTEYRWIDRKASEEYSLPTSISDLLVDAENYLRNNLTNIQTN
ncbi:bis(5'-nucleosyl)-tetraphosphatase [asymmetrical], partial [Hepatocystis sp. ex Piliocolobus tephrosceles]